jgi:hypothetical protein
MKKENYMLKLSHENYMLKIKCNNLQNQIQELKEKQEKMYLNHANTILMLKSKKINSQRSFSF